MHLIIVFKIEICVYIKEMMNSDHFSLNIQNEDFSMPICQLFRYHALKNSAQVTDFRVLKRDI